MNIVNMLHCPCHCGCLWLWNVIDLDPKRSSSGMWLFEYGWKARRSTKYNYVSSGYSRARIHTINRIQPDHAVCPKPAVLPVHIRFVFIFHFNGHLRWVKRFLWNNEFQLHEITWSHLLWLHNFGRISKLFYRAHARETSATSDE